MSVSGFLSADLERIVDFPWEVLEYLTWLRQRAASRAGTDSYLFDEPKVRFGAQERDLLVAEPHIDVRSVDGGLELRAPRTGSLLVIDTLREPDRERVEGLLSQLDGQRPLAALRTGLDPEQARVLDAVLAAAFGKLIFAPVALLAAERAISGVEVTRFPGSPYEVERPYWVNMGAVRRASDGLWEALDDDRRFARALQTLHVMLLMGEDLQSYYLPASPISSGRAAPGRFMLTAPELIDTALGAVFVAGPRVSAAMVGGPLYYQLCCQTLGEPVAALPQLFRDADGLNWGQLVQARAASDAASALWFCPPRPLRWAHFGALRASLAAADEAACSADPKSCLPPLADFHQRFVRLHPFHCGNQSLAMNLVNRVLSRALGAGMPHLFLDHLAIRLSPEAYARAFRRAAETHVDAQVNIAARYQRLASNRTRTFSLLRQLQAAATLEQASALVLTDPVGARLLLLSEA